MSQPRNYFSRNCIWDALGNKSLDQKQKGDKMLDMVLSTYPQNAFVISQTPYSLTVDSNRNATFNIPYTLKWNYDFITAMNEGMSLVQDKLDLIGMLNPATSNVTIMAKDPKDFLFGRKKLYKFNDKILLD